MSKIQAVEDAVSKLKDDFQTFRGRVDAVDNSRIEQAKKLIQSKSKDVLMKALNDTRTDPKVKKLIEKELDDRANRGA